MRNQNVIRAYPASFVIISIMTIFVSSDKIGKPRLAMMGHYGDGHRILCINVDTSVMCARGQWKRTENKTTVTT